MPRILLHGIEQAVRQFGVGEQAPGQFAVHLPMVAMKISTCGTDVQCGCVFVPQMEILPAPARTVDQRLR